MKFSKTLFACLTVGALTVLCGPQAFAQTPKTEGKIAFVDARAFTGGITEYRQQIEAIETEFTPQRQQLKSMEEQIAIAEEVLKRTAGELLPAARQRKIEDLERMKREFKRKGEDADEQYGKRIDTALNPLRQKVLKALNAFALERGVNLVIDISSAANSGALAYVNPQADITQAFIDNYNQTNPGKK